MPKGTILIIAEAGNAHAGSIASAKAFAKAAAGCGADIVKFQTHIFDAESLPQAPNPPYFKKEPRKKYFERTAFSIKQWEELKKFAEQKCRIEFMSSVFSVEAVELLEKIGVKRHKIPSGEVTNIPLLERVAATKKPILISMGMSSWEEADTAIKTLKSKGCKKVTILQCTSIYPCPIEKVGLNILKEFKKRYKFPVGFSDHSPGFSAAIGAVALGAGVIERHFTLSHKLCGPDAKHSLAPEEFKRFVKAIRDIGKIIAVNTDKDKAAKNLKEMKMVFEKSIVSLKNIPKGAKILPEMISIKKPGNGIAPKYFKAVIGKRAKKKIKKNRLIFNRDIEW